MTNPVASLDISSDESFLAGADDMGVLVRSIDWRQTALGALADWPQSLRTTMSICLNSKFPIAVYWGPEYLMLYNQSLVPMVGPQKHPAALGQPAHIVLAEIWGIIEPLLHHVRTTGEATWSEDLMLPLARTGVPEESYFTFTYSPIRDESGGVGGVFCAVVETTAKVIEERRLRLLNALSKAGRARTQVEACVNAAAEIERATEDVPFALLYLFDDAGVATLAGAANCAAGDPLAPVQLRPGDPTPWGCVEVGDDPQPMPLADAPGGASGAVILLMVHSGGGRRFGFVVAGLSPMLSQSLSYVRFHKLLAASISQSVASAAVYQEERKRAEALAELDRAKTAFFSNVSHEFRTPLTLMLGPAEDALAADDLSADDRERWTLVHRNALRLSKLVNTLLDFSRIEAGRVQASYEPTDLVAMTGELASMFRSAIGQAGLTLRLDLSPIAEPAYVDRALWEKIVLNLLSNALKFTFDGTIDVSLRLADDAFVLVVRDTGIGISPAELPHVFDRFYRIKGARARTHEGSGIGLALVAELVKLHGGQVGAESVEGRGTTISVRLPRGRTHLPSDRVSGVAVPVPPSSAATPYLEEALRWSPTGGEITSERRVELQALQTGEAPARIVIADDNADMRDYLARLLRERWDVAAFADGESALAAIRDTRPDLILADVMMPGLDGFGLLQAVRDDADLRLTPVILLSARAGVEATAEGLSAGATDYIVKPFVARDLLVRIASKLAEAKVIREAHAIEEAARQRLYGHFMQAPFPIAVLRGPDHVTELVNPVALSGWGKDESMVGKPIRDGMPELRGQPFIRYLDDVYRTGVPHRARGELARLVRSDDGTFDDAYWDFVYTALRDASGSIDGVLVCGFEVTQQVRAAQSLARHLAEAEASERQFRELVENLPELAWTARPDGFVDYYNQRWYEYTGTTIEEMQGWGWRSVQDPAYVDAVVERWQSSIADGSPFEMEFPLRGADGTFRWFLTRVRPLHDADGHIVRWFGSNIDIDERRRSDTFREMFLGIVGHDLRNPLATILATAQLLAARAETSPDTRTRVERVTASAVRMQRIIEQLLDLTHARLTAGIPVVLPADEIDLVLLVTKIVEEMRVAWPQSAIDLCVTGHCRARVDPDRFEQVISNLLGNAISHGDRARPIRVTLLAQPGAVHMTVHNYGAAINPDLLPSLFNPFARGTVARRSSEGLGLGLFISERIINAHRGSISVESTADAGTRFEVIIPRRQLSPVPHG